QRHRRRHDHQSPRRSRPDPHGRLLGRDRPAAPPPSIEERRRRIVTTVSLRCPPPPRSPRAASGPPRGGGPERRDGGADGQRRASVVRAAATTASGVNPNFFCSSLSGAEAPKVFMPMISPAFPTNCRQPKTEACSTATRAVTDGGNTESLYWALCFSNSSQDGMLTTRALTPSLVSCS